MNNTPSLVQEILQELPHLRTQMYFQSSLNALSHAMEDLILASSDSPLVIANFQQERFYRQEIRRYQQIARRSNHLYILAAPESSSGFATADDSLEVISLKPYDALAKEWHLVVLSKQYSVCLICRELPTDALSNRARRFEGIWTFERQVATSAARLLLARIAAYRPSLVSKVAQAWQLYHLSSEESSSVLATATLQMEARIFSERLVNYLQASQYKLLRAYRELTKKEQNERLINAIVAAMRSSLNPEEVLRNTVRELGKKFDPCRCFLYRLGAATGETKIEYESVAPGIDSLKGRTWSVADNPLFIAAQAQSKALAIDVTDNAYLKANPALGTKISRWQIRSWLLVPVRYQGNLLGMLEIHHTAKEPYQWSSEDISLVEAIATQAGVALTQATAYRDMTSLNEQLAALERVQSNLIAIVGHELRTPLSTIQVCLESIATEPDAPKEFRQIMLDTALADSQRLRRLIQDFLTLSKLESGKAYSYPEPISMREILDLALSGFSGDKRSDDCPSIQVRFPEQLPLVRADGEGLVEVFTKLLDNASKFTPAQGEVTISVQVLETEIGEQNSHQPMLKVVVADTGRGVEPEQLDAIFNLFYQEEDSLRRTVGGTGLGLAICRQIVEGMGGRIWAISTGKDRGSEFHFTLPIEPSSVTQVISYSGMLKE
ncbi:GAF domain-containing protein [Lusitaniella coriacea LEGE 07157]|uniref:histidine kinase n=1 Tax=Lusitaniella coriacea LEGE 07157 TaxID=945747 RepID=A0A8J7B8I6_9CYAN|nr:DICT sensory domain-containing protein [Lusitaniella coriacea]MBE9114553.1 GAF domain-containing protein [Lusitaniella coriacea LEGE 07157]